MSGQPGNDDPVWRFLVLRDKRRLRCLGEGKDGEVFETTDGTAVKLHHSPEVYRRERNAYLRLRDLEIDDVEGLALPTLIDHDDELLILEMTVVRPPFLLDFASAYLDEPPDWPDEVVEHWHEQLRERFEDRYGDVLGVLAELEEQAGVHLFDVHADNLKFDPS
ncbi:MAG: hypothetical protein AAF561_09185 [Planctomycetota bacterium]